MPSAIGISSQNSHTFRIDYPIFTPMLRCQSSLSTPSRAGMTNIEPGLPLPETLPISKSVCLPVGRPTSPNPQISSVTQRFNMSDEFSLFTSLRHDPRLREVPRKGLTGVGWNFENESSLYMLDFHRDRMLKAAAHWKWQPAVDVLDGGDGLQNLSRLIQDVVGPCLTNPLRLRIVVSREGEIKVQKFDTSELPLENLLPTRLPPPGSSLVQGDPKREYQFTLLVDRAETSRSEYTHYKTTKRAMYDSARERAKISPIDLKEALVINRDDGSVMEGTITTPYFWRNDQWVTPPVATKFSWDSGSGGQDGTSRRWALARGLAVEQVVQADSLVDGEECWISNGVRGFISATISLNGQNHQN